MKDTYRGWNTGNLDGQQRIALGIGEGKIRSLQDVVGIERNRVRFVNAAGRIIDGGHRNRGDGVIALVVGRILHADADGACGRGRVVNGITEFDLLQRGGILRLGRRTSQCQSVTRRIPG